MLIKIFSTTLCKNVRCLVYQNLCFYRKLIPATCEQYPIKVNLQGEWFLHVPCFILITFGFTCVWFVACLSCFPYSCISFLYLHTLRYMWLWQASRLSCMIDEWSSSHCDRAKVLDMIVQGWLQHPSMASTMGRYHTCIFAFARTKSFFLNHSLRCFISHIGIFKRARYPGDKKEKRLRGGRSLV